LLPKNRSRGKACPVELRIRGLPGSPMLTDPLPSAPSPPGLPLVVAVDLQDVSMVVEAAHDIKPLIGNSTVARLDTMPQQSAALVEQSAAAG
jgi:hypothetical protein